MDGRPNRVFLNFSGVVWRAPKTPSRYMRLDASFLEKKMAARSPGGEKRARISRGRFVFRGFLSLHYSYLTCG